MQLPDFLTRLADGEIRLAEHRIGLYHLLRYYHEGESAEMLASRYPTLPLAVVHRVIAFYLDNQGEVDVYMASCSAALDQQHGEAKRLDLTALRQRLSTQQQTAATTNP